MTGQLILLIDDNTAVLKLTSLALSGAGYTVRTARNVLRAVEMLHDGMPPPALIITDLMMPQTTGWHLLEHLREDPVLRHVPIIVMTGAPPAECQALTDVVLHKPVDPQDLIATVQRLLAAVAPDSDTIG